MQPSLNGLLRGHRSDDRRALKLWLTLELRLLIEGEQNVDSLTPRNTGNSTLWTKESLAGWLAWRKLGSQSVCTHKHGNHLSSLCTLWLSPCRIPGMNLWSRMPPCEPLTCYGQWCVANNVSRLPFLPFKKTAPVWSQALRGHGIAQGLSLTKGTQGCWMRKNHCCQKPVRTGEFCGCDTI